MNDIGCNQKHWVCNQEESGKQGNSLPFCGDLPRNEELLLMVPQHIVPCCCQIPFPSVISAFGYDISKIKQFHLIFKLLESEILTCFSKYVLICLKLFESF